MGHRTKKYPQNGSCCLYRESSSRSLESTGSQRLSKREKIITSFTQTLPKFFWHQNLWHLLKGMMTFCVSLLFIWFCFSARAQLGREFEYANSTTGEKKKKRSKEKASCLLMSKILIWVLKTRSVVKDPVQPWRFASLTGIQVWREMPMPLLNYFWSFQRTVFYLLKTWNTRHLVAKVAACKLTAAKCVRLFKSLIKLHSLSISQEAACFYATACLSHLISDPSGKQISWLFQPAH